MAEEKSYYAVSYTHLTLDGFTSETSEFPFAVRGLGLGSSLDEVFSRFPDCLLYTSRCV